MGIKILSSETISGVGLQLSNFVISINGRYEIYKRNENEYQCISYLNYYGSEAAYNEKLEPFIKQRQLTIILSPNDLIGNVFTVIYNNIKANYATTEDI